LISRYLKKDKQVVKEKSNLMNTNIPWLYLALGVSQAAHSVEEVLTGLWKTLPVVTGFLNSRTGWVPVMGWSGEGFAAANLIIVALLLGFSPFPFQNRTWAWKVAGVVAAVEILNGLGHMSAALFTDGYFSGCISAVFLFIFGISLLIQLGRKNAKQS
jgi:hypothetical protein